MCSQLLNVMSHGNFASKTIMKEIVLTNRAQFTWNISIDNAQNQVAKCRHIIKF